MGDRRTFAIKTVHRSCRAIDWTRAESRNREPAEIGRQDLATIGERWAGHRESHPSDALLGNADPSTDAGADK